MSTFRLVGTPSSSTLSEPRRLAMVPSSTTVTSSDATLWPTRPENAEVPLRLKSPSRPWPTASWSRMPGQPGPSTTVSVPAGASTAPSLMIAWRAASVAKRRQRASSRKKSKPTRPAAPEAARLALARVLGDHGDVEPRQRAHVAHGKPDGVTIRMTSSSLAIVAMTWRIRGSAARAAAST